MRSDQLSTAPPALRVIRALDALLGVFVVIMFGIALLVARGFRRETLRNIGWAFVIVGLVFLGFRRVAGGYVVDTLVASPYRDAGDSIWATYTGILREIGRATVFYGVVAVLGAVLAGPTAAATATRRRMAPVLNERPGVVWEVTGAAFLLLVLWARPTSCATRCGSSSSSRSSPRRARAATVQPPRVPRCHVRWGHGLEAVRPPTCSDRRPASERRGRRAESPTRTGERILTRSGDRPPR